MEVPTGDVLALLVVVALLAVGLLVAEFVGPKLTDSDERVTNHWMQFGCSLALAVVLPVLLWRVIDHLPLDTTGFSVIILAFVEGFVVGFAAISFRAARRQAPHREPKGVITRFQDEPGALAPRH